MKKKKKQIVRLKKETSLGYRKTQVSTLRFVLHRYCVLRNDIQAFIDDENSCLDYFAKDIKELLDTFYHDLSVIINNLDNT